MSEIRPMLRRSWKLAIPLVMGGLLPALAYALFEPRRVFAPAAPQAWLGYLGMLLGGYLLVSAAVPVYILQETPVGDRPPQRLVTSGVYSLIRNPMAAGMIIILLGEALVMQSVAIFGWALAFTALSVWLAQAVEEPSLRATFGDTYEAYVRSTPRWLPSLRAQRAAIPHDS